MKDLFCELMEEFVATSGNCLFDPLWVIKFESLPSH